jgi:ketosteroid isomerase-like protein
MSDTDDFRGWVETRLIPAERALHDGNAEPRFAVWTESEPVSVLGAWKDASNQDQLRRLFSDLEEDFSDCRSYSLELLVAEVLGDTAYTVAREHIQTSVRGEPRTFTLRVTQIYRREGGEWKACHRHADTVSSTT